MTQEQALKAALTDARRKADVVLAERHTGADAKTVIMSLLQIAESYRDLLNSSLGGSADARVVKKYLEQERQASKNLQKKLEDCKKQALLLAMEMEVLGHEANSIANRNQENTLNPDYGSAMKIKLSSKKVVDIVLTINKLIVNG